MHIMKVRGEYSVIIKKWVIFFLMLPICNSTVKSSVINHNVNFLTLRHIIEGKQNVFTSINVKTMGAKSEVGFDNTKIFQYCIDNYKEIYIPEGEYEYTKLQVKNEGVRLYGDGKGKTILKSTGSIANRLHMKPNIWVLSNNCILENFTSTYKNIPNFKQNAVGRNAINEDANISIGWSEAYAQSKSYLVSNVTIQNCEIKGSVVQGIAIGVSDNVKIINNVVSGTRGTGIFGYYSNKVLVVGNTITETGDDGIYIGANGETKFSPHARNSNVIIKNNTISNASAKGIGISGCEDGEISYNTINSTFVDGILVSKDFDGGHVSPKNVKIFNNTLTNIFGEFGAGCKHERPAIDQLGGFFAMIGIITDDVSSNNNIYEIYNNNVSAGDMFISRYGYYGLYVFGHNVNIYNNKVSNANFGIMIGNPSSVTNNETTNIILKNNDFFNFNRNVALIKASNISIISNVFGDAEWCITEEKVKEVEIKNNYFTNQKKFYLNQTGSKVSKENNHFKTY